MHKEEDRHQEETTTTTSRRQKHSLCIFVLLFNSLRVEHIHDKKMMGVSLSTAAALATLLVWNDNNRTPTPTPSFLVAQVFSSLLQCPPDVMERYLPMMAPLPSSMEELRRRHIMESILHEAFDKYPNAGYEIQLMDEWTLNGHHFVEKKILEHNLDPSTYGEITTVGTRQLLHAMDLFNSRNDGDIHFFDLGSGVGKLVTQTAMEVEEKTRTVKATGVELSPTRHETAIQRQKRLQQLQRESLGDNAISFKLLTLATTSVELIQEDLLQIDLSTATHVYVASLCFPPSLMQQLEDKLLQQSTKLKCVASLKRFPHDLGRSPFVMHMEMSWTKPYGCPVYIYQMAV
jgi:hypothetical protein